MKKIIFNGSYGPYKKGEIATVSDSTAQYYIDKGIAGVYEFAKKPAPTENKLLKPKRQNKKRK
jgi:hypothetical protein